MSAEPVNEPVTSWPALGSVGTHDDNEGLVAAARASDYEWFDYTEQLSLVRDFAHSLMINPWAAMLAVLVRFSADIPPTVVLPGLNGGGRGSLNLYGVFAGKSGAGKSDLLKALDEQFLPRPRFIAEDPVVHFAPGTGEGITARYVQMRKPEGSDKNAAMVPTRVAWQALLEIDEISMLDKLAERSGQTLVDTLKTMWTGAKISPGLADPTRQRPLDAHTYRLALYMGAQPGLGRVLLSKESKLGGFVQRFLFATLRDPMLTLDSLIPPKPESLERILDKRLPYPRELGGPGFDTTGRTTWELRVDPRISEILLAETLRRRTGDEGALDGHILFTKLRVSALLAIMHGHIEVDLSWWDLAESIMQHSEQTREALIKAQADEARKDRRAQAMAEGEMEIIRQEPKVQAAAKRYHEIARSHSAMHEGCSRKCFTLGSRAYREVFTEGIELAEKLGLVVPLAVDVSRNGAVPKWKAL